MPSHCSRKQVEDGEVSYRDWHGNRLADRAAKAAAAAGRLPGRERQLLARSRGLVDRVAMWCTAVGTWLDGSDTTHGK
eukprot:4879577-Pyramimonas_sp.AAC.1